MSSGRNLDATIEDFFEQFSYFTKDLKDDIQHLQRSFENGYSLTPQELRERLSRLEKQTVEVRKDASEIEAGTFGELSLAELMYQSWTLFQETNEGISSLEEHLNHYGYQCDESFLDSLATVTPPDVKESAQRADYLRRSSIQEPVDGYRDKTVAPLRSKDLDTSSSLNQSQSANWLNFDYNATEAEIKGQEEIQDPGKLTPRQSIQSLSQISDLALQCSPGTLHLQKKYKSFERKSEEDEEEMEVDEIGGTPCEKHRATFLTNATLSPPTSALPRLSFEVPAVSFGSPFRSPHSKPESSLFLSTESKPKLRIEKAQYEVLPNYIKSAISHEDLDHQFQNLRNSACKVFYGSDHERSVLESLVQLGFLKKDIKSLECCYIPTGKWQ